MVSPLNFTPGNSRTGPQKPESWVEGVQRFGLTLSASSAGAVRSHLAPVDLLGLGGLSKETERYMLQTRAMWRGSRDAPEPRHSAPRAWNVNFVPNISRRRLVASETTDLSQLCLTG